MLKRYVSIKSIIIVLIIIAATTVLLLNLVKDKYPHVYANEKFQIVFDEELNYSDVFNQGIVIKDEKGQEVSVNLKLFEYNNRVVIIEPPLGGYKPREVYKLQIDSKIGYTFEEQPKNIKEFTFRAIKDKKVSFKDTNLEKAVRCQLQKQEGNLYISDVYKLKTLNAQNYGIQDIGGIDAMPKLIELYLDYNKISDIKNLKSLKKLEVLSLTNNQISDVSSLVELSNLSVLWLGENKINNYSVLNEYYENLQQKDFQIE